VYVIALGPLPLLTYLAFRYNHFLYMRMSSGPTSFLSTIEHLHDPQDVASLVIQGIGGGMAAMASNLEDANRVCLRGHYLHELFDQAVLIGRKYNVRRYCIPTW